LEPQTQRKAEKYTGQIAGELTMSATAANGYAVIFVVPVILLYGLPYYLIWLHGIDKEVLIEQLLLFQQKLKWGIPVGFSILIAGIILHELIHGTIFLLFCKNGRRSVRFGIMWQFLTPYCHCTEPLRVKHYILGALMPAFMLGFLPGLLGIITGRMSLLLTGMIFTFAAGGDFLVVWLLRDLPANAMVLDHESKVGCYVIDKQ
jgi:hypothetical protein